MTHDLSHSSANFMCFSYHRSSASQATSVLILTLPPQSLTVHSITRLILLYIHHSHHYAYIHNVHIYIHIFAHSSGCVVNGSNLQSSPSLSLARDALVLEVSEKEAREHFIHKLQEARRNAWFTSLNWYVHGLAKDNRA